MSFSSFFSFFFLLLIRPPPISTLFPYTTLFRSRREPQAAGLDRSRGAARSDVISASSRRWQRSCSPDRKSTRLNSSHLGISYAVFCLKKKRQCYKRESGLTVSTILCFHFPHS